ncbi:DMT family transporter [Paenibacillus rhizolycopersici]|uniref:DMT family transporter n=1 Tax=Paenibacillus rhizolycopersici TaxID=2780073 RepID=UPI003D2D9055
MSTSRSRYLALLMLGAIWGGSYYFIKLLVADFGPWTVVFFRSALGCLAITAVMLLFRIPFKWRQIPWRPVALMAMVNTCIPWALIGFSETHISSSMASVLNATTPLFSLAVGTLFFGASMHKTKWMGMAAAAVGVLLILEPHPGTVSETGAWGVAGMLLASLFYGTGSQLSGRLLRTLSTYQATFGTLLFSMAGSGVFALCLEPIPYARMLEPSNLGAMMGLGILGSGLAYILFYWLVKHGGPTFATLVTYLLPVFSLLWGVKLLNEPFHWRMIAGLVLILSGVFLAGTSSRKRSNPATTLTS